MMKVYANDVAGCNYLTAKKTYKLSNPDIGSDGHVYGGKIIDDSGDDIFVCISMCSHIDFKSWNLIND